jgi:hypothetical protein
MGPARLLWTLLELSSSWTRSDRNHRLRRELTASRIYPGIIIGTWFHELLFNTREIMRATCNMLLVHVCATRVLVFIFKAIVIRPR